MVTRRLLFGAYIMALFCSLPQIFLRGTVGSPENPTSIQCCDLFLHQPHIQWLHAIFDSFTVFYTPLFIIIITYILIFAQIRRHAAAGRALRLGSGRNKSSVETLKYRVLVGDLLAVRLTALHDDGLHNTLRARFPPQRSVSNPSREDVSVPGQIVDQIIEGEGNSVEESGTHSRNLSVSVFRPVVRFVTNNPSSYVH